MELRHLRYFVVLATELSFGKGAARLGISQPALSLQMAALERELGVSLISRTKRKIELTAAGRLLYERATRIVEDTEKTIELVRAEARGARRKVRVGITGYSPIDFLTWLESANLKQELGLSVVPRVMLLQRILDELHADNLELGLVRLPLPSSELKHKVVLHDHFSVLLPKGHVLARQRSLELAVLRNETFVEIARERGGWFHYTATACKEAGFLARIQEVDSRQSLISTVAAGRGVAMYMASLVGAGWSDVAVVPLVDVRVPCDLVAAWKPGTAFGEIAERLLEHYPVQHSRKEARHAS